MRAPTGPARLNGRACYDSALLRARLSAFPAGEFVGQESFMSAGEVLRLGELAGIAPGISVLDLCCGVGGPGLLLHRELGCSYLGLDRDPEAIDIARERAAGLDCRFECARVPPVPPGAYDVVLLLETMLAFPDKAGLLRGIAAALRTGGRIAFSVEEGEPLTTTERAGMPAADTVWPVPLADLLTTLGDVGLRLRWQADCSLAHSVTARRLHDAFTDDATAIAAQIGGAALADLLASHQLWSDWLRTGRVRKLALVAEKVPQP